MTQPPRSAMPKNSWKDLAAHGILHVSDAPMEAGIMSALLREMSNTAQRLGIPLGVQLDLTYRCNERCVHCYLDHDDHGEMTTAEIKDVLDQLAACGRVLSHLQRRRDPDAPGLLRHRGVRARA